MTQSSTFKGQGHATVVFYVFVLLLTMLLSACGDGSDNNDIRLDNASSESAETGSAVFTITWHDAPTIKGLAKALAEEPLNCKNAGVEWITCRVYDESDGLLKEDGPWPCNAHTATITSIPAGQNRKFVILGQTAGETLHHGETPTPIEIKPGEISDVGEIDTYSFEVISSIPENDPNGNTPVDANDFSFEWNVVKNADSYHIQVSGDTNFEQLAVDQTTTDIEFKPSGLAGATQYYWRVRALDAHGNQGPFPEYWSFITKELLTWYEDSDSDSYGNSLMTMEAATQPAGYVADNTDCDDSDRFTHPGAEEICDDNIDQDCDGSDCKCEYTIRPTIGNFSAIGGDGTITVDTSIENCLWTAISSENWVKIDSGSSGGMGDGTLNYAVAANPETISRIATITVAGKIHEVTQDRRICVPDDYTISPDSQTFNYNGGTGTIDVVATIGCNWSASVSVDWITIISDSNGSGNGTLNYTVAANTNTSSRSAIITVAGKSHEVTQEPQPDIEPPTVKITSTIESPTSGSPIDISGTASDNVGVTQVTWSNNRGGGGVCTGTTSWSASGIALFEGNNIITVTAKDAAGNTGTDALPIIYQEPSPALIWDVSNWDESVWN